MGKDGSTAGQLWGNLWQVPTDDIPDPAELRDELRRVARSGLTPSRLTNLPKLFDLAIVATEAHGNRPLDRAIALQSVIGEAVDELGEGPSGEAVRLLLGMTPRSRGLLLKDRRDLAADHIGIEAETFRKGWEIQLLGELADEVYKLESQRRVPIRVKPSKRRGPILDDLRHGTGKSLDRREAEARLWSLMYALRADLLAVARWQAERPGTEAWIGHAHTALWRYARFLAAMARFMDEYGSALVMAGNEVTVDEAVSLLGWRPPLSDEQAGFLRLTLAKAPEDERQSFLELLQDSEQGREVLTTWEEWLGG